MIERIYEITGTLYQTVTQDYDEVLGHPVMYPRQASVFNSSSTEIYEGARFRDLRQRKALNRTQLDVSASDSWTQHRTIGSSQAFVIQPISSSQHEVVAHGCFLSGSEVISNSGLNVTFNSTFEVGDEVNPSTFPVVPAGFYTTASIGSLISSQLPHPDWRFGIDSSLTAWFSYTGSIFQVSWTGAEGLRNLLGFTTNAIDFDATSVPYTGSEPVTTVGRQTFERTLYYAKTPTLQKQVYKWVASSSMNGFSATNGVLIASTGSTETPHSFNIDVPDSGRIVDVKVWVEVHQASGAAGSHPPLGQFGLSLRAPGVSFLNSHPIRNYDKDGDIYEFSPEEFYRNTFILWEPASLYRSFAKTPYTEDTDDTSKTADPATRSPVWERDRSMRTIFCDVGTQNPRNIHQVYKGEFAGVLGLSNGLARHAPSGDPYNRTGNMYGAGVSWVGSTGSPPHGWLTGAGGVAAAMEFATTGTNTGPIYLQPLYPLLDDIYVRKIYHNEGVQSSIGVGATHFFRRWREWEGYRPGLRGKEMQGRWQLLAANAQAVGSLTYNNTYLRQWRLEITYVQNDADRFHPRPRRSPLRSGVVPFKGGRSLVGVFSGSRDFPTTAGTDLEVTPGDYFISGIYVDVGGEIELNRTVGITHSTSSLEYARGDFAVYTGSVEMTVNTASYSRSDVVRVLDPETLLGGPRTLSTVIRSAGSRETTEQSARRILSGTL